MSRLMPVIFAGIGHLLTGENMNALTRTLARATCFLAAGLALFYSDSSHATMYASRAEAYAACLPFVKLNYEARIVGSYASAYRCQMMYPDRPDVRAYVGEIWLTVSGSPDGPFFWSHGYGIFEWPAPSPALKDVGPSDCCVGNPINFATGNKYQREHDLQISPLLEVTRHYNSYGSNQQNGFGNGWTHTYTRRIEHSSTQYDGNYIKLYRPTGLAWEFFRDTSGAWLHDAETQGDLVTDFDSLGAPTGWTFNNRADRQVEKYDSLGRLLRLEDQSGSYVDLHYNNEAIEGNSNDFRLTKVVDRQGRSLSFNFNSNNHISAITDSVGNSTTYNYDDQSRLTGVEYPGSASKNYLYNELSHTDGANLPLALTGIIDETLQRYATFKFEAGGRAKSTEHGVGGVDKFSVQYLGSYSYVTTPLGGRRNWYFSSFNGVMKPTDYTDVCSGCPTGYNSTTYDLRGVATQVTDRLGVITTYVRDAENVETERVEAKNLPQQRKVQTDWNTTFRVPTERRTYNAANTLVAKSTYTYNTRGQALTASQIDPVTSVARTTTTTYCESSDVNAGTCPLVGLVTSVNGPRTDVADTTTYTYRLADDASCATSPTTCPYRKGDLWKVTNALGQVSETLAYDGAGRVLSVKNANGVVTDLAYHPRGWLTARKTRGANASVETDDAITAIEYWPTGLVKKVIQPDGAFTSYAYDAAHRLTDIADNAGNTIHYTMDNAGNRTQEDTKDPGSVLKRTLSRVYNQLGQLQTQKDASLNPTGFTYDANGNANTVTDALSRVTDNDYDPLNRLSRTLQNMGGINAETQFAYDAQDNLTQVTDPKGLNTTYTYNGLGDLTQLASPDTGTTTYTYDSAGNRATQTDARGQTSTYGYDVLNRLTGIAYATSALNVGYTYDTTQAACTTGETFSTGRLTQLTDASGSTQYCYDRFGNLVRKVQTTNGVALTVRYAYTLAGQLSSVTYPDGAVATYTRDAQGRTTQVNVQRAGAAPEVLLNQASYHPFGPVAGWTYGNGRQLLRPLNQNYQPTAIQDAGTGGLSVGFQYDPVGNLTQLTPAASSTPLVKFDYDALSRLTKFKDGPTDVAIESYAYDATGNRQSFTNSAGTHTYSYPSTSHRLNQVGATVRTYDNAGNTTAIGGTAKEFVYDDTGRMSQVKQNAIVQRNYAYNGKGEQVHKYAGTANTYTLYDETGHWLGDYDNTGTALQQAIWLDDLSVGLIANDNQLHYIEPDHLGTPRVVIEVARNVPVWSWDLKSEAFGNSVPAQDPDGDSIPLIFDMRFPGQRADQDSGMSYNMVRDYDSTVGRYVQSDLIGLSGGVNTFAYAFSTPLLSADPHGLRGWILRPVPIGPPASPISGTNLDPSVTPQSGPDVSSILAGMWQTSEALRGALPWNAAASTVQAVCNNGNDEECKRLNDNVQRAKAATGALGKCKAGMSFGELAVRHKVWLEEATARSIRDTKCWGGGDDGHQIAHANAWKNVGTCASLSVASF